jgi:hypothetical protein
MNGIAPSYIACKRKGITFGGNQTFPFDLILLTGRIAKEMDVSNVGDQTTENMLSAATTPHVGTAALGCPAAQVYRAAVSPTPRRVRGVGS